MATAAAAAVRTAWHQSSSMIARISPPSRSLRIRILLGPRGGRDASRLPPAALIERMRKPATGSLARAQPVTHDCQPCSGLIARSSGVRPDDSTFAVIAQRLLRDFNGAAKIEDCFYVLVGKVKNTVVPHDYGTTLKTRQPVVRNSGPFSVMSTSSSRWTALFPSALSVPGRGPSRDDRAPFRLRSAMAVPLETYQCRGQCVWGCPRLDTGASPIRGSPRAKPRRWPYRAASTRSRDQ